MATTIKQTITEHDIVELTEEIPKDKGLGTWPAGTRGAVICDFGEQKLLDIVRKDGVTLDEPVVPVEKLKLIAIHGR
jgi:predicted lipase